LSVVRHHLDSDWQPEQIAFARAIADRLSIGIQQAEIAQQLQAANREIETLVTIDRLTQLANRRSFDDMLDREFHRLRRDRAPLALILADIDYFLRYNAYYGPQAGDTCLIAIAHAICQAAKRATDLVARYSGNAFAVILPNTDSLGAVRVMQDIRENVQRLNLPHADSPISDRVTLSLGLSNLMPSARNSPQELFQTAELALERAKELGRNCYHIDNL
jgi:diguanylate cyclase (GGDEF)-like protein